MLNNYVLTRKVSEALKLDKSLGPEAPGLRDKQPHTHTLACEGSHSIEKLARA